MADLGAIGSDGTLFGTAGTVVGGTSFVGPPAQIMLLLSAVDAPPLPAINIALTPAAGTITLNASAGTVTVSRG